MDVWTDIKYFCIKYYNDNDKRVLMRYSHQEQQ